MHLKDKAKSKRVEFILSCTTLSRDVVTQMLVVFIHDEPVMVEEKMYLCSEKH